MFWSSDDKEKKRKKIKAMHYRNFVAAKYQQEKRQKTEAAQGGYVEPTPGEGINEDVLSKLGDARQRLRAGRASMALRGKEVFRG